MMTFLLHSTLCLLSFWAIYRVFLVGEKMYQFNRFYLLASLILAFCIPLMIVQVQYVELPNSSSDIEHLSPMASVMPLIPHVQEHNDNWLWMIYVLGLVGMALRFGAKIALLIGYIRSAKQIRYQQATLILHQKEIAPFSFLHYIFLNQDQYQQNQPSVMLLNHELAHVRQKHTLDIFLLELIHCIFWFNPALLLFQHAIRLNHEFLADASVADELDSPKVYMHLLIDFVGQGSLLSPSSYFTFGQTKQRITMMNKTKNTTTMMTKQILLLPVLEIMIWSFGQSKTIYSEQIPDLPPSPIQIVQEDSNQLIVEYEYDYFGGMMAYTLDPKGENYPRGQAPGQPIKYILAAIRVDLKVSFLNAEQEEVVKICRDLSMSERERFWHLDQSKARYFHRSPKVNRPTEEAWKAFQNPKEYGVWLDGVRIENAELARYSPQDIHSYGKSRLMKNAANYGKHTFQLNLYSQAAFDQDYKEKETGYWIPVSLNGRMAY